MTGVYVENLSEYCVKSPEEIGRLLKSGKKKLAIAETKMNRQSSRLVVKEAGLYRYIQDRNQLYEW